MILEPGLDLENAFDRVVVCAHSWRLVIRNVHIPASREFTGADVEVLASVINMGDEAFETVPRR